MIVRLLKYGGNMQVFNSLKEDFAFGQYRFQSLETVLSKDPGYVKWLRETGKIEVNCLYIGESQTELERCKAFNAPSRHVSRNKEYVESRRALHSATVNEDYYSEEDKCTYSSINHLGSSIPVSYNDDGTSTVYWGGPCGSQDYDENGEEC